MSPIQIDQNQYILATLSKWGMEDCNAVWTPMVNNELTGANSEEPDASGQYRKLIGNLLYISTISRPDISYAVNFLSRFCNNPTKTLIIAAKRVLRYLKGTMDYKLIYRKYSEFILTAYSDSDWAGDLDSRKSTSGIVIKCCPMDSPILWRTIRQQSIALSSCEAEYMALAACVQEVIYVKMIFNSVEFLPEGVLCPKIFSDNQGCIALAKNPVMHRRSKHIDIKFHFLRDIVGKGAVSLAYLKTDLMPADILTKPLSKEKLEFLSRLLYGSSLSGGVE